MRFWTRLLSLLLFVLLAGVAFAWWVGSELRTPYYGGAPGETFVELPRGAGSRTIAELLARAGVLRHELPFALYVRWAGAGRRLQAGEYRFDTPATPIEVMDRIVRGDIHFVAVTVPEGLTAREALEQVARSGLGSAEELEASLAHTEWIGDLDPRARNLEGYLFPETYRFTRSARAEDIVHAMVTQFRANYEKLARQHPPGPGWNTRRLVTLASLVEKEVGNDSERPLVASVFVNRLDRGIPLACDPTIIYALKLAGRYDGNIRKPDLSMESPYNTYVHTGLPPGPIANPGMASLRAAMNPAGTEYLYFVSRNDGTHQFSTDYKSHSQAVLRYQKRTP